MSKPRLCVSFSGGKTSAYMTRRLLTDRLDAGVAATIEASERLTSIILGEDVAAPIVRYLRDQYEMVVVFANTGCENAETLDFVDRCDKQFGFNTVWVEAVVHHGEKKGSTHRIVSYEDASRNGEPFEEVIKKYGIPNKAYPHCTRELKENPIRSYLHSIGWETGTYFIAIGIRADEPKRLGKMAPRIYPLAHTGWLGNVTKPEINIWWEQQPFTLNLKDYEGNCRACWKKSTKKLVQIAQETPDAFDFPIRMEERYGLAGYNEDGTKRVFFREWRSGKQMLEMASILSSPPLFQDEDQDAGCSESCDAFLDFPTQPTPDEVTR